MHSRYVIILDLDIWNISLQIILLSLSNHCHSHGPVTLWGHTQMTAFYFRSPLLTKYRLISSFSTKMLQFLKLIGVPQRFRTVRPIITSFPAILYLFILIYQYTPRGPHKHKNIMFLGLLHYLAEATSHRMSNYPNKPYARYGLGITESQTYRISAWLLGGPEPHWPGCTTLSYMRQYTHTNTLLYSTRLKTT